MSVSLAMRKPGMSHNKLFIWVGSIVWMAMMVCMSSTLAQVATSRSESAIHVLVTASGGRGAVAKEDLTATLDSQPAQILNLDPARGQPLVFAILLDISGSSQLEEPFERQSALDLFRTLAVGSNIAYFGDFNDEVYLSHKPASTDAVLKELKAIGRFRGGTALRDAVLEAAKLVSKSAQGVGNRRAVFVISDGEDNASKLGLKQVIPELQHEGVPIFCIGLLGQGPRKKVVAELGTLSEATGGVARFLTHPEKFIPSLSSDIENQYWLTLAPPAAPDGKLHSLSLTTTPGHLRMIAPTAVLIQ